MIGSPTNRTMPPAGFLFGVGSLIKIGSQNLLRSLSDKQWPATGNGIILPCPEKEIPTWSPTGMSQIRFLSSVLRLASTSLWVRMSPSLQTTEALLTCRHSSWNKSQVIIFVASIDMRHGLQDSVSLKITTNINMTNQIRKIYKFAFHVEQYHNVNSLMGWGLKTILRVEALKLS